MARLAFGTALCTDAISYLGQAGGLAVCSRGPAVTEIACFAVMGLTCGVAGMAQLWCLRASCRRTPTSESTRERSGPLVVGFWVRTSWRTSTYRPARGPSFFFVDPGRGWLSSHR
jgi:hypothetical protein